MEVAFTGPRAVAAATELIPARQPGFVVGNRWRRVVRSPIGFDPARVARTRRTPPVGLRAVRSEMDVEKLSSSPSKKNKVNWLMQQWTHFIQSQDRIQTSDPSAAGQQSAPAGASTVAVVPQAALCSAYNDGYEESLIQAAKNNLLHEDIFNSPVINPSLFRRLEELRNAFYAKSGLFSRRSRG